jgi:hypothetical protein
MLSRYSEIKSSVLSLHSNGTSVGLCDDVPWPIVWIAGARHCKRIWSFARVPDVAALASSFVQFHSKYSWAAHFAKNRTSATDLQVSSVTDSLPMSVWKTELHRVVMSAAREAESHYSGHGDKFSNVTPIDLLGMSLLRRSHFSLVLRDKGT